MSKQQEAMRLALEALEAFLSDELRPYEAAKTAAALRAALAEPVQEPVQEPETVDQRVVPLVESALQAVAEKIGDRCAVWYGIGARDVEEVLREAVRHGLVHGALAEPAGPVAEPFVVRHYICDDRPTIKGNGFDGLVVGDNREEADQFVAWVNARIAVPPQQAEPVEPVAWLIEYEGDEREVRFVAGTRGIRQTPLYTAPPQRKLLTIERLRDALVASRIVPPAAVEDPDEYDDGVTLFRIEALYRRIT